MRMIYYGRMVRSDGRTYKIEQDFPETLTSNGFDFLSFERNGHASVEIESKGPWLIVKSLDDTTSLVQLAKSSIIGFKTTQSQSNNIAETLKIITSNHCITICYMQPQKEKRLQRLFQDLSVVKALIENV